VKKRCARCGFNKSPYALDIHHILTPVKKKRNGKTIVLCANCHRIEHWGTKKKKKSAYSPRGIKRYYCDACNFMLKTWMTLTFEGNEKRICFKCFRVMEDFVFHGEGCPTSLNELYRNPLTWEQERRELWFKKKSGGL